MLVLLLCLTAVSALQQGCLFDGKMYSAGERIVFGDCLGAMTCMGDNLYANLQQYGGVCPQVKRADGQTGCLFDGKVYNKNDVITIGDCLAQMTCMGNNIYSSLTSLGGVCKRQVDGQSGCLFDGKVYARNEEILIPSCLGKMTCLGNNNLSDITPLYGLCPDSKRDVEEITGCWFESQEYPVGAIIHIKGTSTSLVCQGNNNFTEQF